MNLRERMRGMRWLAVIFALLVIAGLWGPYSCGGDTTVFQGGGSLMDSMDSYTSVMPVNDKVLQLLDHHQRYCPPFIDMRKNVMQTIWNPFIILSVWISLKRQ